MARLVAVTGALLLLALCHATMSITVQEFFPNVKSNLTKLKWAHRTNNKTALNAVLNNTQIQMIEADVIMGKPSDKPDAPQEIPMMGHPPEKTSDLSLEEFLAKVIANKTKGIKLDFKSIEAFEAGVTILQKNNLTQIPVWLNADILAGPVNASAPVNGSAPANATVPVDPKRFLEGAAKLPQTVLSIGWTTRLADPAANATSANYTMEQLKAMSSLLAGQPGNQSVTYPVRACFAANDVDGFKYLLNETAAKSPTLTVWSSEGDPVNATLLSQLIKRVGLDKVYVDVPASLYEKLDLSNAAGAAKSSLGLMLVAVLAASLLGPKLL